MKIGDVTSFLEKLAPPSLQETYDNAGLITGNRDWNCTGILCCLDALEAVVDEAISKGCNLVVAHHPILFRGLKRLNGNDYVERALIKAIKNDIAIYAIHTNLDNVIAGVSGRMAEKLGLMDLKILAPRPATLRKIFSFVPSSHVEIVINALFKAGAGVIGNYDECSFQSAGLGTFKAGEKADPFVGEKGKRHEEKESKVEMIFPSYLEPEIVRALKASHPYEEVAFDVVDVNNVHPGIGSGVVGLLPVAQQPGEFLELLKNVFQTPVIRHTVLQDRVIHRVALCGGAGSFLIHNALRAGADAFVTADLKYHEFFDADGKMLLADIGHFESEQFTVDLLQEVLVQNFLTFAVLKTTIKTNPVYYR